MKHEKISGSAEFYRNIRKPLPNQVRQVMDEHQIVFDVYSLSIESVINTLQKAKDAGATEVYVSRNMMVDRPWEVSLMPTMSAPETEEQIKFREAIQEEGLRLSKAQRFENYKEYYREFGHMHKL